MRLSPSAANRPLATCSQPDFGRIRTSVIEKPGGGAGLFACEQIVWRMPNGSETGWREVHGCHCLRLAAFKEDERAELHWNSVAGSDYPGARSGSFTRGLGTIRTGRAHGLAHASARADLADHFRPRPRTDLGRPDPANARRGHGVDRAGGEALARGHAGACYGKHRHQGAPEWRACNLAGAGHRRAIQGEAGQLIVIGRSALLRCKLTFTKVYCGG